VKKLKTTQARPKAVVPPKPPAALILVHARLMPGMTTPIAIKGFVMRKLLSVALPLLSLLVAVPAFSQGTQTPNAPNATPPSGTATNTTSTNGTAPKPNATTSGDTVPNATTSDKPAPNATKPD